MSNYLSPEQLQNDLAVRDLSDPAAGAHAIQVLLDTIVDKLLTHWHCAVRTERGSRVVAIADNYDNLGFNSGAISRDVRYSRYVDQERMLRSHSSAIVPPVLRDMATRELVDTLLVCPGVVYRRDSIDRLHTGTPQQMDLWRISPQMLGNADLEEMIGLVVEAVAPGTDYRSVDSPHPYTEGGRQVDVNWKGEWVEIGECGLAHPAVLRSHGLDGATGLAMGIGLDRLLMLKKGIPDVRLLRSNDRRIADQMLDLAPYRPVSSMPPITRDLSVAVGVDDTEEELGDRVRNALGSRADMVEGVSMISTTSYDQLPAVARERIGISPDQQNVLVRVVIRALDRTLTHAEANGVRDEIYAAIHQGSTSQWTS